MIASGNVAMFVDSVRVYQSRNSSAHVGADHTLGCDPPDFPTRQFIKGSEYKYSRSPPWSYTDSFGSLRPVQNGGGKCTSDADCGTTRGSCGTGIYFDERGIEKGYSPNVCLCNKGFTGPHCLAIDHVDDFPSAYKLSMGKSMFLEISKVYIPPLLLGVLSAGIATIVVFIIAQVTARRNAIAKYEADRLSTDATRPLIPEKGHSMGRTV